MAYIISLLPFIFLQLKKRAELLRLAHTYHISYAAKHGFEFTSLEFRSNVDHHSKLALKFEVVYYEVVNCNCITGENLQIQDQQVLCSQVPFISISPF